MKLITQQDRLLILGGGSGWILESINALSFDGEVWYIEASSEMIRLASKRQLDFKVHFIHGTEENIPQEVVFDAVITNFYLDLFPDERLPLVLEKDYWSYQIGHGLDCHGFYENEFYMAPFPFANDVSVFQNHYQYRSQGSSALAGSADDKTIDEDE